MIKLDMKIDKRFLKTVAGRYGRATFEAGVLQDKPYRRPLSKKHGFGTLAGGRVRRKSGVVKGTVANVSEIVRKVHRVDYLRRPFLNKNTGEMKTFRAAMMNYLTGKAKSRSPVETALRAAIRLPILEQRYGRNSRRTAKTKGFNRKLIDTGQLFRAIIARVRIGRRSV